MATVGVIGAGLMGAACAQRCIEAGFEVNAYDVDRLKAAAIAKFGARACSSIGDTVKGSETVVLAVLNTDQVEQVMETDGGVLDVLSTSTSPIVVCTSTCDPDRLASLGARAKARGGRFLEVPISGSSRQVSEGNAVGLVGGDHALMLEASRILDAICPRRFYLGEIGNGSRAKLAVNLVLGLNRAAIAEGLVFAERLGLEREAFLKVARGSAGYSQVMDVQGTQMARREFHQPQSRVAQNLKDFHIMLAHAAAKGQRLPFASVYVEMLEDCVRNGEADWDNAVLTEAILRCRSS